MISLLLYSYRRCSKAYAAAAYLIRLLVSIIRFRGNLLPSSRGVGSLETIIGSLLVGAYVGAVR